MTDDLKTVLSNCDAKRDHNYDLGADSFTITTREYAMLRDIALRPEVALGSIAIYDPATGKCRGDCDCALGETCKAYLVYRGKLGEPSGGAMSRAENAIKFLGLLHAESEACSKIIDLAREICANAVKGMKDGDPHKGVGDRLADALVEYDKACAATKGFNAGDAAVELSK